MKKILIAGLVCITSTSFAQKIDAAKVPASVKTTFEKNFSGSSIARWENEKGNYEASFIQNGKKMSALFDANGKWLETETGLAVTMLPAAVNSYLSSNYKGEKVKEAAQIKMASGETNYEAEVNGTDLIFDANGKFIKAVKD